MEQTTKRLCPICEKTLQVEEIIVDGYFDDILNSTPNSVESVMVETNGEWHTTDRKYGSATWRSQGIPIDAEVIDLTLSDSEDDKPPARATSSQPQPMILEDTHSRPVQKDQYPLITKKPPGHVSSRHRVKDVPVRPDQGVHLDLQPQSPRKEVSLPHRVNDKHVRPTQNCDPESRPRNAVSPSHLGNDKHTQSNHGVVCDSEPQRPGKEASSPHRGNGQHVRPAQSCDSESQPRRTAASSQHRGKDQRPRSYHEVSRHLEPQSPRGRAPSPALHRVNDKHMQSDRGVRVYWQSRSPLKEACSPHRVEDTHARPDQTDGLDRQPQSSRKETSSPHRTSSKHVRPDRGICIDWQPRSPRGRAPSPPLHGVNDKHVQSDRGIYVDWQPRSPRGYTSLPDIEGEKPPDQEASRNLDPRSPRKAGSSSPHRVHDRHLRPAQGVGREVEIQYPPGRTSSPLRDEGKPPGQEDGRNLDSRRPQKEASLPDRVNDKHTLPARIFARFLAISARIIS